MGARTKGLRRERVISWLGHSTVLLEIDGYRVLTDPVWSERISPVSFAGPRRFHPRRASGALSSPHGSRASIRWGRGLGAEALAFAPR